MSLDIVDDLQAAEDYGENIRSAARAVVEEFHSDHAAKGESLLAMRIGLLDEVTREPFRRPTCEDDQRDWTADGSECPCGGYHPEDDEEPSGG